MKRGALVQRSTLWFVHALGDSSEAFEPLFGTELAREYELVAPDWPLTIGGRPIGGLDELAAWLVAEIDRRSPVGPVGLVGHSLGAAVAVRAAHGLERVAGLFSIEGNLTAADAYLSGLAAQLNEPQEYRDHLLARIWASAAAARSKRRAALRRYHASVRRAGAESLWRIGRAAKAASRNDGLGLEYEALSVPKLYYWSPDNTPTETQTFIEERRLAALTFRGGHWPMVEQPDATARRLHQFFESVLASRAADPALRSVRATRTMPAPPAPTIHARAGRATSPRKPPSPSPAGTAAPAKATVTATTRPRKSPGTAD
jgi:thioesterase domain-containing protein